MSAIEVRMLINGEWRVGTVPFEDRDPYRDELIALAPTASPEDLDLALDAAVEAFPRVARLPSFERQAILQRAAELVQGRKADLARTIARETGKALKDSLGEIERSVDTLRISGEEAKRIQSFHVPLDGVPMGEGKIALMLRFPVGVVAAITPFNAPFNLMCHKVGPAFAAGNTVVLKPPHQAPLIGMQLGEVMQEAGFPAGALNIVYGAGNVGERLITDLRVDFVTFTGSNRAGEAIRARSGLKRLALELGGDGPTIVHGDADVRTAAITCSRNAFRLAGQSCTSVQRVYVQEAVVDQFLDEVLAFVPTLNVGDPLDPRTDIGTLVDQAAASRVESWVREAEAQGARVLCGGARQGAQMAPTVVTNVTPQMKIVCQEVFGPVVVVVPYRDLTEAIRQVNESRYGLQCGVYSSSLEVAFRAIREIRAGGIIINGTSTWRIDQMPYGGVKQSGIGREGPRYAIEEMTEQRLVVFNL
ncbi:MAG: aldehyde dehydrogenase family protein [Candidatus Methylomirabilota bacterium]|jgi:acyl-CoA reductase-like NAD-dependent aldehyde dehydrogenase